MPLGEGEWDSDPPWGIDLGWRCEGRVVGGAQRPLRQFGCRSGFVARPPWAVSRPQGAQLIQNVVEKVILNYEFTLLLIKNRGFSKFP